MVGRYEWKRREIDNGEIFLLKTPDVRLTLRPPNGNHRYEIGVGSESGLGRVFYDPKKDDVVVEQDFGELLECEDVIKSSRKLPDKHKKSLLQVITHVSMGEYQLISEFDGDDVDIDSLTDEEIGFST